MDLRRHACLGLVTGVTLLAMTEIVAAQTPSPQMPGVEKRRGSRQIFRQKHDRQKKMEY